MPRDIDDPDPKTWDDDILEAFVAGMMLDYGAMSMEIEELKARRLTIMLEFERRFKTGADLFQGPS